MMQMRPRKEKIGLVINHIDLTTTLERFPQMPFCLLELVSGSFVFTQSQTGTCTPKQPFGADNISFVMPHLRKFSREFRCCERIRNFSSKQATQRLIRPYRTFLSHRVNSFEQG